ncbi:unnamed protein product [Knipowitschia caucasica]|uniref:Uncharacterized protein n=1 Tax=Knipowitschia caucasica TaxID=637954 RepID=A0AAV2LSR9_KNICA
MCPSGCLSLLLYYRFLHPKSTEIWSGRLHPHMGSACIQQGDSSFSLGDKSQHQHQHQHQYQDQQQDQHQYHGSLSVSLFPHRASHCPCSHHHWLLIRLALKTGDLAKINRAYGAGGAAAILDLDDYNDFKSNDHLTITAAATCEGLNTPISASEDKGAAPLSDCKDEFQSVSELLSSTGGEDSSLDMETPTSDKRSSPEGKSVFGDSPEPYFCPTESSSTLYFSADPQSPCSGSMEHLSSIPSDPALHRDVRSLMVRGVGPRCTSTPRLDCGAAVEAAVSVPHLSGPRRQLIMSRRDPDDTF